MAAFSATAVAASAMHGSATDRNTCTGTFDPPVQPPPSPPSTLGITIASDASPAPHDLDPVTLSNTTVEVHVPAGFLQTGVDAGIFADGKTFPATVALVIAGSNTVEATHAFEENTAVTLHVVDGAAQSLTASEQLPDTIWHPTSAGAEISFAEKSAQIVVTIDRELLSPLVVTLECAPSAEGAFVALGGLTCPVTEADPCTKSTTTSAPESTVLRLAPDPILPRTGSSSGYAVVVALSCLAGGALLLLRRRRDAVG